MVVRGLCDSDSWISFESFDAARSGFLWDRGVFDLYVSCFRVLKWILFSGEVGNRLG